MNYLPVDKMNCKMSQNRVILWTSPRSLSTAFERCIMQLPNGKVIHEPFSIPYHFGPERRTLRHSHIPDYPNSTYADAEREIQANYEGKSFVFVKDMAQFIQHKIEDISNGDFLPGVQHTFLIRNPLLAVKSFYKATTGPTGAGFDPSEVGYEQLYMLFSRFNNPIVIDADDLLDKPELTMKAYCSATNLRYIEGMTKWQNGKVPKFAQFGDWHKNVLESGGISRKVVEKDANEAELPNIVVEAILQARPIYEKMYQRRIVV